MAARLDEARRETARAVIDARKERRQGLLRDVPDSPPATPGQTADE